MNGSSITFPPRQPDYGFDVISEAYQNAGAGPQKDTPMNSYDLDTPPIAAVSGFTQTGQRKGPSTYLHAGSAQGWPANPQNEDTFDLPCDALKPDYLSNPNALTPAGEAFLARSLTEGSEVTKEYTAEYDPKGRALLILNTTSKYITAREIGSFDTMADAQLAAQALNDLNGF